MKILIAGGSKSGKSDYAQTLALQLAGTGRRFYVATMIPFDGEDQARIAAHRAGRAGMGFETVEEPRHLLRCLENGPGAYLIDSVTALLTNALFPQEADYRFSPEEGERCLSELLAFARQAEDVVLVMDFIFSDSCRYSPETEHFRRLLGTAGQRLAALCDTVLEASAGQIFIHKGALPK